MMNRMKSSFLVTTALLAGVSIASAQGMSGGAAARRECLRDPAAECRKALPELPVAKACRRAAARESRARVAGLKAPPRAIAAQAARNAMSLACVTAAAPKARAIAARIKRWAKAGPTATMPVNRNNPARSSATAARIAHRVRRTRRTTGSRTVRPRRCPSIRRSGARPIQGHAGPLQGQGQGR